MRKEEWKEYFHFTRKETTGIIVLLVFLLLTLCLPSLMRNLLPPVPQIRSVENDRIIQELHYKKQEDSVAENEKPLASSYSSGNEAGSSGVTLFFAFDPNTLDDEGWLSLGLSKRTVKTVRNYLSKGGRFRKAEDIKRIYGISPSLAEKLIPYVSIATAEKFENRKFDSGSYVYKKSDKFERETQKSIAPSTIDINTADSLSWLALDGIGPALTHRILTFREKLGGFYSIHQVAEVFGLPDSTFQQVKPLLKCAPNAYKTIPLNSATEQELEQHPYIRKKLAKLLIAYRTQHGAFQTISDLGKMQLIDSGLLAKLVPYISLD